MTGLTAVIMAAGASRRMGENKLLLKVDGREILRHLLESIPYNTFDKIALVYSDDAVGNIAKEYPLELVKTEGGQEKCITIRLGTEVCQDSDGMMFLVADQPFLDVDTINKLANQFDEDKMKIVIPFCDGRHRNPVIFPKSTYGGLKNLSGDVGGRDVIKQNKHLMVYVDFDDERQFADIDTRDDYEKYK